MQVYKTRLHTAWLARVAALGSALVSSTPSAHPKAPARLAAKAGTKTPARASNARLALLAALATPQVVSARAVLARAALRARILRESLARLCVQIVRPGISAMPQARRSASCALLASIRTAQKGKCRVPNVTQEVLRQCPAHASVMRAQRDTLQTPVASQAAHHALPASLRTSSMPRSARLPAPDILLRVLVPRLKLHAQLESIPLHRRAASAKAAKLVRARAVQTDGANATCVQRVKSQQVRERHLAANAPLGTSQPILAATPACAALMASTVYHRVLRPATARLPASLPQNAPRLQPTAHLIRSLV